MIFKSSQLICGGLTLVSGSASTCKLTLSLHSGGGPRVVVSTAAFHARVRGSVPGLGGFKETKMFLPHPRVKVSIVGSLRDREVACSASDRQGSNFESCVCHLIHLIILRRFSWPSLAYMCTKVAWGPIHFISFCKLTMSNLDIFAILFDVLTINPFIAGTVFIRQNLTSADFRSWRIKAVSALNLF